MFNRCQQKSKDDIRVERVEKCRHCDEVEKKSVEKIYKKELKRYQK